MNFEKIYVCFFILGVCASFYYFQNMSSVFLVFLSCTTRFILFCCSVFFIKVDVFAPVKIKNVLIPYIKNKLRNVYIHVYTLVDVVSYELIVEIN